MATYVVLRAGIPVNLIEWDGVSVWQPPTGVSIALYDSTVHIFPQAPPAPDELNKRTLWQRSGQAIDGNATFIDDATTFLAIASPTNTQVVAQIRALTIQVRSLTKQSTALIRLVTERLDSIAGT